MTRQFRPPHVRRSTVLVATLVTLCSTLPLRTAPTTRADDYPTEVTIVMRNNTFRYDFEVVAVGATVTWRNEDSGPRSGHNILSDDGSIQSPLVQSGESWSFTFTTEGYYHYVCELHDDMEGAILVVNAE